MKIELAKLSEIEAIQKMIEKTVRGEKFSSYYPKMSIDYLVESLNFEGIKKRMEWTHFYVAKIDDAIIGCGAIGPYWDSETESSLFNIFVDPDFQGQGIGRKIVETLESDEFFVRAKRIEVPASMVAIPFYKKLGYEHKNGELNYEDGHFKLEKFNKNYKN
jgi:N-acetylglutamate synthase-like GNAT family acetyltransferase